MLFFFQKVYESSRTERSGKEGENGRLDLPLYPSRLMTWSSKLQIETAKPKRRMCMDEWMGEREDCGRSWVETIPPKNEPGTGSHERVWDVKLLNIITVSPIKLWVSVFFFFFLSVHAVVFFFSFPFLSFYCIIIMVWLRQFSTSQGL